MQRTGFVLDATTEGPVRGLRQRLAAGLDDRGAVQIVVGDFRVRVRSRGVERQTLNRRPADLRVEAVQVHVTHVRVERNAQVLVVARHDAVIELGVPDVGRGDQRARLIAVTEVVGGGLFRLGDRRGDVAVGVEEDRVKVVGARQGQ
ncbi:hypothetical protein D3C80_729550 [compost metagenome]